MRFETKYAPQSLADYVWPSASARAKVELYIANKMDGHLLLHGKYGSGKTTLAKLIPLQIARQQDPNCAEVYYQHKVGHLVNADAAKVLRNNATLIQLQLPKQLVVIDEADQMTDTAMKAMKGIIDDSQKFCSFIFCTNHKDKIEGGILSRCTSISFDRSDVHAMAARAKTILANEGVRLPDETIGKLVNQSGGDYRCLLRELEVVCLSFAKRNAA